METSMLTPRDRQLAELGMPPIDVDPPRLVTPWDRVPHAWLDKPDALALGYRPYVHRGCLIWLRNDQ